MARKYVNSRAEVTAAFPSFTGIERKNPKGEGYPQITESITVPATPDAEGRYRLQLAYVPLKKLGFAVTVNSLAKTPVRDGTTLASSEVGVGWEIGTLDFHSSLAGLTGSCVYEHKGTGITALDVIQWEKMLEALQGYVYPGLEFGAGVDVRQYFIPSVPLSTSHEYAGGLLAFTETEKRLVRIHVFAGDVSTLSTNPSDVTIVRVKVGTTNQYDVNLPVTAPSDGVWRQDYIPAEPDQPINFDDHDAKIVITTPDVAGGHGNIMVELTFQ